MVGVCKQINLAFSYSTKKRLQLKKAQVDLGLPQHQLKTDSSTRWGSTYTMMLRILEQQEAVKRVLVDDPKTAHLLAGWWQTKEVLTAITTALKD